MTAEPQSRPTPKPFDFRLRIYGPGALLAVACVIGLIAPFQQWQHLYPPNGSPWPMILPDANPVNLIRPDSIEFTIAGLPMLVVIGTCLLATILALLAPRRFRGAVRATSCVIAIITGILLIPLSFLASFQFSNGWSTSHDLGSILALISFPSIPTLGLFWRSIARDAEWLSA